MGTDFDAFDSKAKTRYFEELLQAEHTLAVPDEEALNNRRVLFHALTSVGFTNYPEEWWHFDLGNQFWASVSGGRAVYGPCLVPWETAVEV